MADGRFFSYADTMDALPAYVSGLAAVLLLTSFIKIFTSLNILRYGLGLHSGAFGIVIAGLSFALTLVVMTPYLGANAGIEQLVGKGAEDPATQSKLRPFIEKHAHKQVTERLNQISLKLAAAPDTAGSADQSNSASQRAVSYSVLIASFVISELQEAFYVGLLLLVPFVILDLVVANVLTALNITQLPLAVVALPLKLFVFFAVDGWQLVSEKLLNGYLH